VTAIAAPTRWHVPLADVAVDDAIVAAVEEAVRSGWWSAGPRVGEFERRFADFCGVEHALAVANGTAALHLALLASGCGPGDEVLLPSLNFVAAANTIVHTGATPVFCDIGGPDDLNVSPDDIAAAISPATKAVVVMHYGGHPCRMAEILACAAHHGLVVIEDAAHAPGARWQGTPCGAIGAIGCFSFFSNKNLATGEGGMVVTDDAQLAEALRLLRSHGMTTLTWDRHRGHAHAYDVVAHGFNYRLDELHAAIGLVQLERLPEQNDRRASIVAAYRDALDGVDGLSMPFGADGDGSVASHHLAVVVLPEGCARDVFRTRLTEAGVQTSVHYPPIHRFSRYRDEAGMRPLPVTDAVADRVVTLPLYPHMEEWQVTLVVDAVRAATAVP
jgi:dTDP-4-amino-4,6-dideoxygalactose transaminase